LKLLIVRHGESAWNVEGRYQGRRDAPLSLRGAEQARALARHLAGDVRLRPAAIVASPLSRTLRTAQIVAESVSAPVSTDERIIEICHGAWEGMLKGDVARRWPDMMLAWKERPDTVTFPGGESLADVQRRWRDFVGDLDRYAGPLLVVTHDVLVRLALLDAHARSLSALNEYSVENAALTLMECEAGKLQLVSMNDAAFLGPLRADILQQAL
jgi:probable phosphoglycerate mutase